MSEKDKMLRQMLYDANGDAALNNDRIKCKDLCYEFNMIKPSQTIKKEEVIKKILGKVKGKFVIMAPFWCDYGYNIEIGSNFFLNHNCTILDERLYLAIMFLLVTIVDFTLLIILLMLRKEMKV